MPLHIKCVVWPQNDLEHYKIKYAPYVLLVWVAFRFYVFPQFFQQPTLTNRITNICFQYQAESMVASHFVTSYGRFVKVSSSHPSYLTKGILGVQHFVIAP